MKVLDLACPSGHVFEGWFGSEGDYQSQRERRLLECPFCGSNELSKRLSAPRLNLKASAVAPRSQPISDAENSGHDSSTANSLKTQNNAATSSKEPWAHQSLATSESKPNILEAAPDQGSLQAAWLAVARQIMRETHDVGDEFVSHSRRMHYGEMQPRAIRGHASPQEVQELREEGIDVLSFSLPDLAKETLQ